MGVDEYQDALLWRVVCPGVAPREPLSTCSSPSFSLRPKLIVVVSHGDQWYTPAMTEQNY